jgi:ComF family protein
MSLQHGDSGRRWKPGPRTRALARATLDLIFPPQSLDDTGRVQAAGLSAEAWSRIHFIDGPVCDGCGLPFEYDQGPGVRCVACTAKPRAFARARAACLYDEASRGVILQFKHADRTDLAPLFARWLARAAWPLIGEVDAVVPTPLHRVRLLQRRYNQAAEMARPFSRLAGLDYLPDALVRVRATASQGGRSAAGRRRNVAAAFETPAAKVKQVAGRRILLVDDVMTTGATAEGCARALLQAGAARVDVAVIARVKEAANRSI